jgi:hypothetical protein
MPGHVSYGAQDFNFMNPMQSMHDMNGFGMHNSMGTFAPTQPKTQFHHYPRSRNSISHHIQPQMSFSSSSSDELESTCIYYNQEIVLQCTKTGLISGPLIVRRVEKGSLAVVGCGIEDPQRGGCDPYSSYSCGFEG